MSLFANSRQQPEPPSVLMHLLELLTVQPASRASFARAKANELNLLPKCARRNHTIFGEVVVGQDVVDKISKCRARAGKPHKAVLLESVTIERVA